MARFFQLVGEISDFSSFEPEELWSKDNRAVVLGHYKATVRATGRVYDCDWAMAFSFRDGKVSKFQEYTDTAALAAALQSASAAGA